MRDVILTYRLANEEDLELYYKWANDADVRNNSFSNSEISLEEHNIWFLKKLNSNDSILLLFFLDASPVGQLRIDLKEGNIAEIDYSVDKNYRGKKIGSKILKSGVWLINKFRPGLVTKGIVKVSNIASIKAFENAGFIQKEHLQHHNFDCYFYYSNQNDRPFKK